MEAIGWNQYGGWRLGIRSFDKKRYYYYAHLRQNFPYNKSLKEGSIVQAGDVIGYMGHTGYSKKENVNNIDETIYIGDYRLYLTNLRKREIMKSGLTAMKLQNFCQGIEVKQLKTWRRRNIIGYMR